MTEGCGCQYHPKISDHFPHCRRCGSHEGRPEMLSRRGLCIECAVAAGHGAAFGLATKSGPYYERFRARLDAIKGRKRRKRVVGTPAN